jgi:hypothetical protein
VVTNLSYSEENKYEDVEISVENASPLFGWEQLHKQRNRIINAKATKAYYRRALYRIEIHGKMQLQSLISIFSRLIEIWESYNQSLVGESSIFSHIWYLVIITKRAWLE